MGLLRFGIWGKPTPSKCAMHYIVEEWECGHPAPPAQIGWRLAHSSSRTDRMQVSRQQEHLPWQRPCGEEALSTQQEPRGKTGAPCSNGRRVEPVQDSVQGARVKAESVGLPALPTAFLSPLQGPATHSCPTRRVQSYATREPAQGPQVHPLSLPLASAGTLSSVGTKVIWLMD